jgi:hypothetical protein
MKNFLYKLYGPVLFVALVVFVLGLALISIYVVKNCTEGFICALLNHVVSFGRP